MKARTALGIGGLTVLGVGYWARTHPSACPYSLRFFVQAPHPGITRERLLEILAPKAGEQVLEIGPGTGHYSLEVASRLDGGRLAVFDLQREFLDYVTRVAGERGIANVDPTQGDARSLPYGDSSFDAAFFVTVLGEIPDQDAALRELHRVLRPGGRVVVGETMFDPHYVSFDRLCGRAREAGFVVERKLGGRLAYFALLRR
jgi:SAM-dependent methyltransferase